MFITRLTGWGIRLNFLFVCDFVPYDFEVCVFILFESVRARKQMYLRGIG